MSQNRNRNSAWHAFYTQEKIREGGSREFFLKPKPHETPFPTECIAFSKIHPNWASGKIYFEPGQHGKLIKCVSDNEGEEFKDVISFYHHLEDLSCRRQDFLDAMKMMEDEPEIWANLDT